MRHPKKKEDIVQQFYNVTPFPDYELNRFETKEDLKLGALEFSRILDRSIPKEASIMDVGTGTGQLSAFLSLRREKVWGVDFSDSSLAKAMALKEKLHLDSLHLKKMNILDSSELESIGEQFDYLLCLGVLHHTKDPYQGFCNIVKLVKPGGYVAIGLYNRYGRILLRARRFLVRTIFKNSKKMRELFIRMQIGDTEDKEKVRGWWNDQYMHPRETSHTVGEVLRWFKANGIKYIDSMPSLAPFDESDANIAGAWNSAGGKQPNPFIRAYKQFKWIWTTHRDGGYWVMFGTKNE